MTEADIAAMEARAVELEKRRDALKTQLRNEQADAAERCARYRRNCVRA